jgi:SAM-dependent methyltransferase
MPLRPKTFDKVLCIGVLQHTPDVKKSFQALVEALKPGGDLAVDVYRWRWVNWLWPRYWLRGVTKRLPAPFLYRACERYIRFVWPLTKLIHRLPFGRKLNRFILVPDFRGVYPLSENLLKQWAILDTFDNLSPTYDQPQTLTTVERWFHESGLEQTQVHFGYNGIEGRAKKPVN